MWWATEPHFDINFFKEVLSPSEPVWQSAPTFCQSQNPALSSSEHSHGQHSGLHASPPRVWYSEAATASLFSIDILITNIKSAFSGSFYFILFYSNSYVFPLITLKILSPVINPRAKFGLSCWLVSTTLLIPQSTILPCGSYFYHLPEFLYSLYYFQIELGVEFQGEIQKLFLEPFNLNTSSKQNISQLNST